ncbi:MAG: hypothetical protein ACK4LT_05400 [Aquificaceae bacterium]
MGKGRVGRFYAQPAVLRGQRGVALINALALSIMIGLLIAGLYTGISILFKSTEEMRTFTSVREAAAAGARYAASMSSYFDDDFNYENCGTYNLEFKIAGREGTGTNRVIMCNIPQVNIPGCEKTPASGEQQLCRAFKIVSEARFGDQVSRVEAVYVRE